MCCASWKMAATPSSAYERYRKLFRDALRAAMLCAAPSAMAAQHRMNIGTIVEAPTAEESV